MVKFMKINSMESILALAMFILAAVFALGFGGLDAMTQMLVLVLLGVVVGVLSIRRQEKRDFLLAILALVIVPALLKDTPMIGSFLYQFLTNLAVGFSVVVAIFVVMWIWEMAKKK